MEAYNRTRCSRCMVLQFALPFYSFRQSIAGLYPESGGPTFGLIEGGAMIRPISLHALTCQPFLANKHPIARAPHVMFLRRRKPRPRRLCHKPSKSISLSPDHYTLAPLETSFPASYKGLWPSDDKKDVRANPIFAPVDFRFLHSVFRFLLLAGRRPTRTPRSDRIE